MAKLKINGVEREIALEDEAPLLWVLRDELGLTGTKFGCGVAACGACTVLVDGQPTRSCVMPISALVGKEVTTIEGAPARKPLCCGAAGLDRASGAAVRLLPARA